MRRHLAPDCHPPPVRCPILSEVLSQYDCRMSVNRRDRLPVLRRNFYGKSPNRARFRRLTPASVHCVSPRWSLVAPSRNLVS